VAFERRQVGVHLNLAGETSEQVRLKHTRDAFKLVLQIVPHSLQPGQGVAASQVYRHDREVVRVDLVDERIVHGVGKIRLGPVDSLVDLLIRLVGLHVWGKLDDDC